MVSTINGKQNRQVKVISSDLMEAARTAGCSQLTVEVRMTSISMSPRRHAGRPRLKGQKENSHGSMGSLALTL